MPNPSINLNTILCAIDLSDFSKSVIDYAEHIALQNKARLIVFHADYYTKERFHERHPIQDPRFRIEQSTRNIQELMRNRSVTWEPLVVFGHPVEEIKRTVEDEAVDLVVAASHGLSGLKRLVIGTVVERMARQLHCPFLVIRSQAHAVQPKINNILVGYDFKPKSDISLRFSIGFADVFNATLHLMHVMESPLEADPSDELTGPYEEVQKQLQDRYHQKLSRLIPDLFSGQIKTVVLPGVPGEEIIKYASEMIDLIVVGVHHHSTIGKLFVGSSTEAMLRHAPCPVLVIPSHLKISAS